MDELISLDGLQSKIFTIRGVQVMIDSDLAKLYGVETKVFNQAVKRNLLRFPKHFRFQLTEGEYVDLQQSLRSQNLSINGSNILKSQIVTSSQHGGRRYLPYVFTEQGVSMLSAVLRSETAIQVSIQIMDAFVQMRQFMATHAGFFQRLDTVERKQLETDSKFEQVFQALEAKTLAPTEGIFFDGQIYDAYRFAADLIRSASKSLILIDNYVDDTVLTLLAKRKPEVTAKILTQHISKQLALDLKKHKAQYPEILCEIMKKSHDRFLIIDGVQLYHLGASLKDLGKKWFAFSRMEDPELLANLLKLI